MNTTTTLAAANLKQIAIQLHTKSFQTSMKKGSGRKGDILATALCLLLLLCLIHYPKIVGTEDIYFEDVGGSVQGAVS
jgi:hypothetical protein